jgi:glyoxylase-like metal-dependent hydrolase (beta-lactamase superfamily II)
MLTLKCIGTGSLGNMYLLDYDGENLLIELGMPYKDLLLNIDDINSISGACYGHTHLDHALPKTIEEIKKVGVKIITPTNTKIGKRYKLGSFEIVPLPAIHNVECRAYLIRVGGDTVLFATDTRLLPKVNNVKINYFIIEVNYIEAIREKVVLRDTETNGLHLNGIYQNHHSLESAVEYFESLPYKPKKIVTIHKSNSGLFDGNSVVKELSRFSREVFVAENNTEFVLEEI